jgi:hypothetical protein
MHAHVDRRPLGSAAVEKLARIRVGAFDQHVGVTEVDRLDRERARRR